MRSPKLTENVAEKAPDPPGILRALQRLLPIVERLIACSSKVGNPAFFDTDRFSWIAKVEACAPAIRIEVNRLLNEKRPIPGFEEFSEQQRVLSDDRRWMTFFFFAYGVQVERNIAACPESWNAIQMISGATSACFSILERGKALPLHRGPYNGVLRYHLGIRIPDGGEHCGLIVDGEMRRWSEGKSIVFDDTYRHAAFNESDEPGVVLFVDFVRPLYFPASWLNRLFIELVRHSRYLQEMKQALVAWEERHAAETGSEA